MSDGGSATEFYNFASGVLRLTLGYEQSKLTGVTTARRLWNRRSLMGSEARLKERG